MLDTRKKILTPAEALTFTRGRVVFTAYFDVLTAPLIRYLCGIEHPITAVVLDRPASLLSQRARTELAASLACVEAVVPVEGDPEQFLQQLNPADIIHWEAEDLARIAQLIQHVQERYRAE